MKTTGIFIPYTPTDESLIQDALVLKENIGVNIIFLQSTEGEDWYNAQKNFAEETLKIAFDEKNIIRTFSYDASALIPINLAVAEVSRDNVPVGFDLSQLWTYNGNEIVPYIYTDEELLEQVKRKRDELLSAAQAKIVVTQAKMSLGRELSEEQITTLNEILDYIDKIESIEFSKYSDVEWPSTPW